MGLNGWGTILQEGIRDIHAKKDKGRKTLRWWCAQETIATAMVGMAKGAAMSGEGSVQSLSRVPLCDPMACSMPGFSVRHHLPEFAQTHVHWVSDAIQLSHPLSPPSPLALSFSQHQGLFQWVSSSHQVTEVLDRQSPCTKIKDPSWCKKIPRAVTKTQCGQISIL